jgi:hypothetical protein
MFFRHPCEKPVGQSALSRPGSDGPRPAHLTPALPSASSSGPCVPNPLGAPHLRHTHSTLLLEDGLDAKYVSQRLGHDSVQTTLELYGHVSSRRRRDAALRIGAMLDDVSMPEDPVPENEGGPTRSDPSR